MYLLIDSLYLKSLFDVLSRAAMSAGTAWTKMHTNSRLPQVFDRLNYGSNVNDYRKKTSLLVQSFQSLQRFLTHSSAVKTVQLFHMTIGLCFFLIEE